MAQRQNENNKYGLHIFKNSTVKETGVPDVLVGDFGDIFKEEYGKFANAVDRTGKLYLYRMPKCIKKSIFANPNNENTLSYAALSKIASSTDPDVNKSEFVKKLNWVIAKRECYSSKEAIEELCKKHGPNLYSQLEVCLAKIFYCMVLVDKQGVEDELEFLNEFFNTRWTRDFITQIVLGYKSDAEKESVSVKELILSLKTIDKNLWLRFKELVFNSCACIAKCDGRIIQSETEYMHILKNLFE